MAQTFRDMIKEVSPRWLRNGTAEKVLYAIALHADAIADAANAGVSRRWPNVALREGYTDHLPLLARNRKLIQGPSEPNAMFAKRLPGWLDAHRRRGNPYALLEQIRAYYQPSPFRVDLVYRSGTRFIVDAGGTYYGPGKASWGGAALGSEYAWPPDGVKYPAAEWDRAWLIYFWPFPLPAQHQWGDPGLQWGQGLVWGSGLSPSEVASLRLVPKAWGNEHSRLRVRLINSGDSVEVDV